MFYLLIKIGQFGFEQTPCRSMHVLYNTLYSYTNVIIESSIYADKLNYEKYLVEKKK